MFYQLHTASWILPDIGECFKQMAKQKAIQRTIQRTIQVLFDKSRKRMLKI